MNLAVVKERLRNQMRQRRKLVSQLEAQLAGQRLLFNVIPLLETARNVLIYYAWGSELSVDSIIKYCLAENISLIAPIAWRNSKKMNFEQIYDNVPRNIFYPDNYAIKSQKKLEDLDLVFVPLLAIDYQGFRLGQGGGYYDTTFAQPSTQTRLCGVGYDWQLVDRIAHNELDIQLDYFLSDKSLYKFIKS